MFVEFCFLYTDDVCFVCVCVRFSISDILLCNPLMLICNMFRLVFFCCLG